MWGQDRQAFRRIFIDAFAKHSAKQVLSPLETIIATVCEYHPEHHAVLTEDHLETEFPPEHNPFFHLAAHVGLIEQLQLNSPKGITELYKSLRAAGKPSHDIEHQMIAIMQRALQQESMDEAKLIAELQQLQNLTTI